jgi:large subunit ribosomal protein L30
MAKIKLTLVKSTIDRPQDQKDTVKALGFRKVYQTIGYGKKSLSSFEG